METVSLQFDGDAVSVNQTPNDLDMEDGDCIDAIATGKKSKSRKVWHLWWSYLTPWQFYEHSDSVCGGVRNLRWITEWFQKKNHVHVGTSHTCWNVIGMFGVSCTCWSNMDFVLKHCEFIGSSFTVRKPSVINVTCSSLPTCIKTFVGHQTVVIVTFPLISG